MRKLVWLSCLCLGALATGFVYAENKNNEPNQIQQLTSLLQQINHDYALSQRKVYLSNDLMRNNARLDNINSYINQLITMLNSMQSNQTATNVPTLQWIDVSGLSSAKDKLLNVGEAKEAISICRADFIGDNPSQPASYPGQLTAQGCRISYAGYAFIMSKYAALVGTNAGLQWITVKEVKTTANANKSIPAPSREVALMSEYRFQYMPFPYDIKINQAVPVVGGIVSNTPVLICRAKKGNAFVIGKVVFFMGKSGRNEDACDIGVDDKEVVVQHNYDILFWKNPKIA